MSNNVETKHLLNLAYRMLGSMSDAEDLAQETWLKYQELDTSEIENERAYLSSIITHLAIDLLRKRKRQAATYIGPWLPEPVPSKDIQQTPAQILEFSSDLSVALLFMLERLKPQERAVFVLKEAFDYRHNEIADLLDINIEASRKTLSRAKASLRQNSSNQDAVSPSLSKVDQKQLVEKIMLCFVNGDTSTLRTLLSKDVTAFTDGGGNVSAALVPLVGQDKVITVFSHLAKKSLKRQPMHDGMIEWLEVNGELGLKLTDATGLISVTSFQFEANQLSHLFVQRNPEKLKRFATKTD